MYKSEKDLSSGVFNTIIASSWYHNQLRSYCHFRPAPHTAAQISAASSFSFLNWVTIAKVLKINKSFKTQGDFLLYDCKDTQIQTYIQSEVYSLGETLLKRHTIRIAFIYKSYLYSTMMKRFYCYCC